MTAAASASLRVSTPFDIMYYRMATFQAVNEKFSVFLTIPRVPIELKHCRNSSGNHPDSDTSRKRGEGNRRNHLTTCKIITTKTTSIKNEKRELTICSITHLSAPF